VKKMHNIKKGQTLLIEARTQKDRGPWRAKVEEVVKKLPGRYGGGGTALHITWLEGSRRGNCKRWVPKGWIVE